MKQQWLKLSDSFLTLTSREVTLIFISGLVVFFMLPFSFSIGGNLASIKADKISIAKTKKANRDLDRNIKELSSALALDPNKVLKKKITELEGRLVKADEKLLTLTEELINPIEMRLALIKLLKLQKGVSLLSFEVLPAKPVVFSPRKGNTDEDIAKHDVTKKDVELNNDETEASLGLFQHGIKLKLSGKYFQLRDYLQQLEDLPWKFFWHNFQYELKEYPVSELKIEIYSLSTNQEFVGV